MIVFGLLASLAILVGQTTQWAVISVLLLSVTPWRRVELTFLHWVLLTFFAYACAALAWTYDLYDGGWGLWTLTILALAFWLGSSMKTLRSIYVGLALGLTISSMIAVFQFFDFHPMSEAYPHCTGDPAKEWRTCWHVAGMYHNPMIQGAAIALTLVALASERLWYLVPGLIPGFVLAGSRGAIVALVIGLHAVFFRRASLLLTLAGIFALAFAVNLGPSDWDRFAIWDIARQGLSWLGYGPGSFAGVATATSHPEHVHNDFLQLAFEYGIGATLLLGVWLTLLTCSVGREWPVFLTFSLLALVSFPLYTPILALVGALAAGSLARDWGLDSVDGDSRRRSIPARSSPATVRPGGVRSTAVSLEQGVPNSLPNLG